jgi:protoheme IX farnesyltransferase
MKAAVQVLPSVTPAEKSWLGVYADLFKARLTGVVLLTAVVGFYMGCRGRVDGLVLLHTVLGTALVAAGGSALNQFLEREYDARMRRTRERPLPSGRLLPGTALAVGSAAGALGLVYLTLAVNALTGALGAVTLFTYVLVYTPLKRVTWLNTVIGAIPGALPPVMGWVAARGGLSWAGLVLFGIQALWQVPHFMAIAWIYREEYARAGFKMLPVVDGDGRRTGRQAIGFALALLGASVLPFFLGLAGAIYLWGAAALGVVFAGLAIQFGRRRTVARARLLFYASILYLPLLLAVMVGDKIKP